MRKHKWLIIWLSVLIAVLVASSVVLVFTLKKNDSDKDKNNTSYVMEYLQGEYDVGDYIVYRFTVYSDIEFVALSYKVGMLEEQQINNVKTGESSDLTSAPKDAGKYYADTKVQVIDTFDFEEGYYTVIFYGYDEDNTRYQITGEPYLLELVAAEVA